MKKYTFTRYLCLSFVLIGVLIATQYTQAALKDQVEGAFVEVYGRKPNAIEKTYWVTRVVNKEKTTLQALKGAMSYQKDHAKAATTSKAKAEDKTVLIKDVLTIFINIYKSNPTEAEKAWWRKRISCNEIKTRQQLISSMNFHKSKNVRKGSNAICGQVVAPAASAAVGVAKRAVAGIGGHVMGDTVRIGIHKTDGAAIHVTANNQFQVREGASKILATVGKDDVVQVSWSGGKYHVRGAGLELDTEGKIRLVPLSDAIMQIKSYSDPSASYPGKNYNRFRGVIEIRKCDNCKDLWAINELRVEYYLRGLGETSGNGPEEYIKALGIAARTYVLYHKIVTGGRSVNNDYDIGATATDQIYRGYEYEIITPRMSEIFGKVKGVVATDSEGDKLVTTVYFSDSDGRTRSAQEAWNSSRFPHLQSVDDPHHQSSSCKGHCVGMSAQGAYGFANKDGWNYSKILKYFYKGIGLVKAY